MRTKEGFGVGDRITYETIEDPNVGKSHYILGRVIEVVSPSVLVFVEDSGSHSKMKVCSQWCSLYEEETNHPEVIRAQQSGGEIVDEKEVKPVQLELDFTGSTNGDR